MMNRTSECDAKKLLLICCYLHSLKYWAQNSIEFKYPIPLLSCILPYSYHIFQIYMLPPFVWKKKKTTIFLEIVIRSLGPPILKSGSLNFFVSYGVI